MLDIQYIRENSNRVSEAAAQKGYPVDVAELLQLDARRRELVTQIETVRSERNSLADKLKKGKPYPFVYLRG
jgi:seryl-tRNA synthetase